MIKSVRVASVFAVCWLTLFSTGETAPGAGTRVGIVVDAGVEGCAEYGLVSLETALKKQNASVQRLAQVASAPVDFLLVAGLTSKPGPAVRMLKVLNVLLPEGPEALVIRRTEAEGKPTIILCGSDARGLMYAALDAADRVSWSAAARDPFTQIRDISEKFESNGKRERA